MQRAARSVSSFCVSSSGIWIDRGLSVWPPLENGVVVRIKTERRRNRETENKKRKGVLSTVYLRMVVLLLVLILDVSLSKEEEGVHFVSQLASGHT